MKEMVSMRTRVGGLLSGTLLLPIVYTLGGIYASALGTACIFIILSAGVLSMVLPSRGDYVAPSEKFEIPAAVPCTPCTDTLQTFHMNIREESSDSDSDDPFTHSGRPRMFGRASMVVPCRNCSHSRCLCTENAHKLQTHTISVRGE
eukprot:GEMP01086099.1.p1 GENE.GEMP01086099.1~~GEMP01086099.1.p1  ORF type:complete len:147 (+),score=17.80 GEMP01086099.1:73-513(+)